MGRVVLHCWLSSTAQWYDCLVFMALGVHLIAAYLPDNVSTHQRLLVLAALFYAGHVLRPFGMLLWPALSAKHGRGVPLWTCLGISAFSTAFVGCMPNYEQVS
jgi:hypothetical protein